MEEKAVSELPRPSQGRILRYRGKFGLQLPRAAIVTACSETLDPRGVETGAVPDLDSPYHVHLWVWTPATYGEYAATGGFPEFNVPHGDGPGEWSWPPRV